MAAYNWGAHVFAKDDGGTDWDADALADAGTETSNTAISLDEQVGCEVGLILTEDNTGAIDGVVTVYVLGTADGTNYETTAEASQSHNFTPVQNATRYYRFSIDPKHFGSFVIAVENQSGQELAVSVKYRLATTA